MSTTDMWFDRFSLIRRKAKGLDPTTHLPSFENEIYFEDEPCDLFFREKRVAQSTPSGTVYSTIQQPIAKIFPQGECVLPDPDDAMFVNGLEYRVLFRRDTRDPATFNYQGSQVYLQKIEPTSE
jgi:hypothetical protein